ncbi:MAG: hypothetical protein ACKOYP_02070 [Bacteroidota bacterium]
MKYSAFFVGLLVLICLTRGSAQQRLELIRQDNPSKIRVLNLRKEYLIQTIGNIKWQGKIHSLTDSSLSIVTCKCVYTGRDSVFTVKFFGKSHTINQPLLKSDTVKISFDEIKTLKFFWFNNRKWVLQMGAFGTGLSLGLLLILPMEQADPTPLGVDGLIWIEAAVLGITIPAIYIGTRKTSFDLREKWKLQTGLLPARH